MERLMSRVESTQTDRGYCKILFDGNDEVFLIEFHDNNGKLFFTKVFSNATYPEVEEYANVWANGTDTQSELLLG